jgi:hypothetical protein
MAMTSLTQARLRKSTLIVLVVTVVAFVAALSIRELEHGSSSLLTTIYQGLGAIAGLGTAFVVVFVPLYSWQESRKNRREDDPSLWSPRPIETESGATPLEPIAPHW